MYVCIYKKIYIYKCFFYWAQDTDQFEIADKETLRLQFKQMKLDTYIQELFNTFNMSSVFKIVSRLTSRTDLDPNDIKMLEERYNVVFDRNDLEFQLKENSLKTLGIFVRPPPGDIPLHTCKCDHLPGSESSLYPLSNIFCCPHTYNLAPPSLTSSKNMFDHPPVHQFAKPADAPSSNLLVTSSAHQSAGTSSTQSSNKPVRSSANQSPNKPIRSSATVSSKTFNNSSLVWSTIQPTTLPILKFSNLSINPSIAPSTSSTKNSCASSLVDSSDEPTDNSLNDLSKCPLNNASNNVSTDPPKSNVLSNNLSNNPMKPSSTENGTELEKSVIMAASSPDHFLKEAVNKLPKSDTDNVNNVNNLFDNSQTNSPNGLLSNMLTGFLNSLIKILKNIYKNIVTSLFEVWFNFVLEEQSDHSNNLMKLSSTESGSELEEAVITSASSLDHFLKQPTSYLQKLITDNILKNLFYNSQTNLLNEPLGCMSTSSSNSTMDYSDEIYRSMTISFFDSWFTSLTNNQSDNSSDYESDSTKTSCISDSE